MSATQAYSVRPGACYDLGDTVSDSIEITYAAHTATCTFLLDAAGICQRVEVIPNSRPSLHAKNRDNTNRLAASCVGAQYVASLDPTVTGMLVDMPRVGAAMLFARVDARGRVSLVRVGIVTRFETLRKDDPFQQTDKPSASVETSAPPMQSLPPTPRIRRANPPDPYEGESDERTRQIQAVRPRTWPTHALKLIPPPPPLRRQKPMTDRAPRAADTSRLPRASDFGEKAAVARRRGSR